MFAFINPIQTRCLHHGDQIDWLLKEHGEPAFARASVLELWGLSYDTPKVDDQGFFKEPETLLDVTNGPCRVQIIAAEACFQCWSMSWHCSFGTDAIDPVKPSIWSRTLYTAKANALYWGLGKVNRALVQVADDWRESSDIRQRADELLVQFHVSDTPTRERWRCEALKELIENDPAYAEYRDYASAA